MKSDGSAIGAPEQPQECFPARLLVGRHAQQRAKITVDDHRRLQRFSGRLGLGLVQQAQPFLIDHLQSASQHRLHQGFFGTEVVIGRRQIDAGCAGHHPHGSAFVSVLHKHQLGRIENALPRIPEAFIIGFVIAANLSRSI